MNLDREVHDGIIGGTAEKPKTLVDVIRFVDYRQHLMITFEELTESLERLSTAGSVVQHGDGYLLAGVPGAMRGAFVPVTREVFANAVRQYRKQMKDFLKTIRAPQRRR